MTSFTTHFLKDGASNAMIGHGKNNKREVKKITDDKTKTNSNEY